MAVIEEAVAHVAYGEASPLVVATPPELVGEPIPLSPSELSLGMEVSVHVDMFRVREQQVGDRTLLIARWACDTVARRVFQGVVSEVARFPYISVYRRNSSTEDGDAMRYKDIVDVVHAGTRDFDHRSPEQRSLDRSRGIGTLFSLSQTTFFPVDSAPRCQDATE